MTLELRAEPAVADAAPRAVAHVVADEESWRARFERAASLPACAGELVPDAGGFAVDVEPWRAAGPLFAVVWPAVEWPSAVPAPVVALFSLGFALVSAALSPVVGPVSVPFLPLLAVVLHLHWD